MSTDIHFIRNLVSFSIVIYTKFVKKNKSDYYSYFCDIYSNMSYKIPELPLSFDVETKAVLKQTIEANRRLAELKGVVKSMPNASILINTLALQEAKDSSAIENIITTHNELYRANLDIKSVINEAKEALLKAFSFVKDTKRFEVI